MLLEYACRVARVRKRAGFIKRTQPHSTEKEGFEPSRLLFYSPLYIFLKYYIILDK